MSQTDPLRPHAPAPVTNEALLAGVALALVVPAVLFVVTYPVALAVAAAFGLGLAARRIAPRVTRPVRRALAATARQRA